MDEGPKPRLHILERASDPTKFGYILKYAAILQKPDYQKKVTYHKDHVYDSELTLARKLVSVYTDEELLEIAEEKRSVNAAVFVCVHEAIVKRVEAAYQHAPKNDVLPEHTGFLTPEQNQQMMQFSVRYQELNKNRNEELVAKAKKLITDEAPNFNEVLLIESLDDLSKLYIKRSLHQNEKARFIARYEIVHGLQRRSKEVDE